MKERDIQRLFSKVCDIEGVFELKITKSPRLEYKSVKDHQIEALQNAKTDVGVFFKIPDGFNRFGGSAVSQKPFDCFLIKHYPAFVGVCYYKPRKPKLLYLISINAFVKQRELSDRKSLTEKEAEIISTKIYKL